MHWTKGSTRLRRAARVRTTVLTTFAVLLVTLACGFQRIARRTRGIDAAVKRILAERLSQAIPAEDFTIAQPTPRSLRIASGHHVGFVGP